jgi:3-oxoacyl-[acyl-carrier protein] reductase
MGLSDGRTAVVTGGARGIGLEIALLSVEHGARVVLGDVDGHAIAKAVAAGDVCDVRRSADREALLKDLDGRTLGF